VFGETGTFIPEGVEEAMWPVSLLHGDLSTGNIMTSRDGRLFVIDWERCEVGPIAWDFKKLFWGNEQLVYQILTDLSAPGALEPKIQMLLVAAFRIIQMRRNAQPQPRQSARELPLLNFLAADGARSFFLT
jgi:hypothetical protein